LTIGTSSISDAERLVPVGSADGTGAWESRIEKPSSGDGALISAFFGRRGILGGWEGRLYDFEAFASLFVSSGLMKRGEI